MLEYLPPDLGLDDFGHAGNTVLEAQPVEHHVLIASGEQNVGFPFGVPFYVNDQDVVAYV